MSLHITYPEAERIKLESAQPFTDAYDDEILSLSTPDGSRQREIKMRDINSLVTARMKEITANVLRVIRDFEAGARLGSGIVLAGQGSLMRGFINYLQSESKFVSLAREFNDKVDKESTHLSSDIDYAGCAGLIYRAEVNCVEPFEMPVRTTPTSAPVGTAKSPTEHHTKPAPETTVTDRPVAAPAETSGEGTSQEPQASLFDLPSVEQPHTERSRTPKSAKRKKSFNWFSKIKDVLTNDDVD